MFAQMQAVDWSGMAGSVLILILLLSVLIGGWVAMRRRFFARDEETGATWDLQQLRELRDRGELTLAQYERIRSDAIAAMTAGVASARSGRTQGESDYGSRGASGVGAEYSGDDEGGGDGEGGDGDGGE